MSRAEQISRRIKLRHLELFVAAVEQGSMAQAAEHLGTLQPVVSKAIAELERTLGQKLLDRGRAASRRRSTDRRCTDAARRFSTTCAPA